MAGEIKIPVAFNVLMTELTDDGVKLATDLAEMRVIDTSTGEDVSLSPNDVTEAHIEHQVNDIMLLPPDEQKAEILRLVKSMTQLAQMVVPIAAWALSANDMVKSIKRDMAKSVKVHVDKATDN